MCIPATLPKILRVYVRTYNRIQNKPLRYIAYTYVRIVRITNYTVRFSWNNYAKSDTLGPTVI